MFRARSDIIRSPALQTLKPKSEAHHKCHMCSKMGFANELEVLKHLKKNHSKEIVERVIESTKSKPLCLVCLVELSDMKSLHAHYNESHFYSSPTARRVEREIFVCDYCQKIFFHKQLLELHIFHKHNKKAIKSLKKIKCPMCTRRLPWKVLSAHYNYHEKRPLYHCVFCYANSNSKELLHEHIRITHKKHFVCNICGFVTTRADSFNTHLDCYEKELTTFEPNKKYYKKYFLLPHSKFTWKASSLRLNQGLRGLILYNGIHICILCRHICYSEEQASIHIYRDHHYVKEEIVKKLLKCSCGEEFSNPVLLKHHLFKMKESGHYDINAAQPVPMPTTDPE